MLVAVVRLFVRPTNICLLLSFFLFCGGQKFLLKMNLREKRFTTLDARGACATGDIFQAEKQKRRDKPAEGG